MSSNRDASRAVLARRQLGHHGTSEVRLARRGVLREFDSSNTGVALDKGGGGCTTARSTMMRFEQDGGVTMGSPFASTAVESDLTPDGALLVRIFAAFVERAPSRGDARSGARDVEALRSDLDALSRVAAGP
jgi:hypothetical protein